MSVDIKDHRKFVEGKLRAVEADEKQPLLPQAESTEPSTGDDKFDKLIRCITELSKVDEEKAKAVAIKGMGCVQEEVFRLQQFEYFFTQGKIQAFKEAMQLPSQIIAEAKLTA